jgi:hypothetical protein
VECDRDYGDVGGFWLSCVVSVVVPVVELVLPFASVVVVVVVLLLPDVPVVSVDVDIAPLDCVSVVVSVSRVLWLQPAATTARASVAASGASFVMRMVFMQLSLG